MRSSGKYSRRRASSQAKLRASISAVKTYVVSIELVSLSILVDDRCPQGLLQSMTAPGGQIFQYTYIGRYSSTVYSGVDPSVIGTDKWALEYVIQPDNTPSTTDNPRIQYLYENANFPFALTGIINENGVRWATYTYGTDGRVTAEEHAGGIDHYTFSYDDVAFTVTVTNPLSKQAVYHFEKDNRGLGRPPFGGPG